MTAGALQERRQGDEQVLPPRRFGFDSKAAIEFLDRMFPDGTGRIGLSRTTGSASRSECFDLIRSAVAWAADQDERPQGIYFRTTTLVAQELMNGRRGTAADTYAVTMLAADLDFGTVGHKPSPNGLPPSGDRRRRNEDDQRPAHADDDHSQRRGPLSDLAARRAGVDHRRRIGPTSRRSSDRWQKIIEAAGTRLGWHYGNVGDLSRLLRLPGSINRKEGGERPCRDHPRRRPVAIPGPSWQEIADRPTEPPPESKAAARVNDACRQAVGADHRARPIRRPGRARRMGRRPPGGLGTGRAARQRHPGGLPQARRHASGQREGAARTSRTS